MSEEYLNWNDESWGDAHACAEEAIHCARRFLAKILSYGPHEEAKVLEEHPQLVVAYTQAFAAGYIFKALMKQKEAKDGKAISDSSEGETDG